MVGTRSKPRRPVVHSLPAEQHASSGTIIADDHVVSIDDGDGYVTTRQTEQLSVTDFPPRRNDLEHPRNLNHHRSASTHSTASELNDFGEHVREAISVISRLEGLGLQRMKIPLPRCIVLGEQSAGKSSVIEAISGIRTPRADGTCTKCPMFIKMESSPDPQAGWKVQVFLRQTYEFDGKPRNKFPCWIPSHKPTEILFASTDSPVELEILIKKAQLAILSPLSDPKDFLDSPLESWEPDADKSGRMMKFSPNVICIYVTQPGLPALSFYDLPGLIGQAETEDDRFSVQFVKDLVSEYVEDPDSLILVTCSLANDIANSTAGGIARELKATNRCIGVLTKPDRLPEGTRYDNIQAVLDGDRFALGHGYFVVKNPNQAALDQGLTHKEARIQEREFFTTREPWSMGLHTYQNRLGTYNLQKFLSKKLATQITKMLPTIREKVEERLAKVEENLKEIPEPPTSNAIRIISDITLAFAQHVQSEMEVDYNSREWRNTWDTLRTNFFTYLKSMKPSLKCRGDLDKDLFSPAPGGSAADSIMISDSDNDNEEPAANATLETPQKRRKIDPSTPTPSREQPSLTPSKSETMKRKLAPSSRGAKPNFREERKVFSLDSMVEHLKLYNKSKIPGQIQPKVIEDLMMVSISKWQLPLDRFLNDFEQALVTLLQTIFHKHFNKWEGSELYKNAWSIVKQMLDTHFVEQRSTMAKESFDDEREGPHIFHKDVFDEEKDKLNKQIRQKRYNMRLTVYGEEFKEQTNKEFSQIDKDRLLKDATKQAVLRQEPYQCEIDVVAHVMTYYMVAARRFSEAILIRIESKLFKSLRTSLRGDLDSSLGIHSDNGPQTAVQLLAEPAQRMEHRKHLIEMKNALMQGLQWLQDLREKCEDGGPQSQTQSPNATIRAPMFASFGPTTTPLTDDMEDLTRNGLVHH